MQPLNAIDAIGPAFSRTNELMFAPFKMGRSWKLAATAYMAWVWNLGIPFPLIFLAIPWIARGRDPLPVAALISVVPMLIYLALMYCFVRFQLVAFELVVTRSTMIAPMWRKYGRRVWPWLGVKILGGILSMLLLAPLVVALVRNFMTLTQLMPKGDAQPNPEDVFRLMGSMFGFYAILLLAFFVPKTFATLLDDFALPFFVLEELSLWGAIRRGAAVFAADPWQCLGYLFMKLILAVAGAMVQGIALEICMIPVVLIVAAFGFAGYEVLHTMGAAGTLGMVAGGIVLGLVFFSVAFYLYVLSVGYLMLLLDAYAIYFLGGRYPMLGNLLEPGPGAPFAPPPVFPSEEERKDDDDGPPMPMNPAVA